MNVVSVREMKARWAKIEALVKSGEEFEVHNRGTPTVRIIPARPRPVLQWDDHLATSVKSKGRSSEETVRADRDGSYKLQNTRHLPRRLCPPTHGDSIRKFR